MKEPAESYKVFHDRVAAAWETVRAWGGEEVCVVAHGGTWKMFGPLVLNCTNVPTLANATPVIMERGKNGSYTVVHDQSSHAGPC